MAGLDRRADGYYRQPGFGGGGLTGGDAQQLHLQWPPSGIPRPALYHHTFYAVRHSGDRHLQLVPRQRPDKDPEFQKFISVPENHRYVYGDAATLLDRVLPRSNWIAMWIFLATIALVAVLGVFRSAAQLRRQTALHGPGDPDVHADGRGIDRHHYPHQPGVYL